MPRIRVKNFGPIREGYLENDGWIDIEKVSVFIGDQGTGKSTIAKLISLFTWMEKALVRGDIASDQPSKDLFDKFWDLLAFHRIERYLMSEMILNEAGDLVAISPQLRSQLQYEGAKLKISVEKKEVYIETKESDQYLLPQISYIPAERNIIANVQDPRALYLTSRAMIDFVSEFNLAKNSIREPLELPVNASYLSYNKSNDKLVVHGRIRGREHLVSLLNASSGLQSIVPLFVVSWYLASIIGDGVNSENDSMSLGHAESFREFIRATNSNVALSEEQRRILISEEARKFRKTAFINIVEEPEQNLYPTSQRHLLMKLLEFNNYAPGNKLIMTTHSPYIVNYLTVAIKGHEVLETIKAAGKSDTLLPKLEEVISEKSVVANNDVAIYEMHANGTISKLSQSSGIPSDDNLLNKLMGETNDLFSTLLEIEDEAEWTK